MCMRGEDNLMDESSKTVNDTRMNMAYNKASSMERNSHYPLHYGMDVERTLHMNLGFGENSYAHNSNIQKKVLSKVKPILQDIVQQLHKNSTLEHIMVADLGCASGCNTFSPTFNVIDAIVDSCRKTGRQLPELTVFLNDLHGNDFNLIFNSLPMFYEKLKKEKDEEMVKCYVAAMPGSFYGRLFARRSLHLVHSSYSVHWLSEVPKGLENNKGNVYMGRKSPNNVFEAYAKQFAMDFKNFLSFRAVEIVGGGKMLLTFLGRSSLDPKVNDCSRRYELLSEALVEMAHQGRIKVADIDSFNLPLYTPFSGEVKDIVEREGSFIIDHLETFEMNWDYLDDDENPTFHFDPSKSAQNVRHTTRAVTESLLSSHFDAAIMDELFEKYARLVGEHLAKEKTKYVNLVVSLTKR